MSLLKSLNAELNEIIILRFKAIQDIFNYKVVIKNCKIAIMKKDLFKMYI